jgi:hypothetical protein
LGQIDNLGEIDSTQFATLGITQQQVNDIQPGGSKEYRTIVDNQGRTIDYELDIVASDDVVWNWKKNIDKMIEFYESKISEIVPRINTIRNQINAWNNAHPNDLVVFPVNQIEGNITYGAIRSDIDGFDTYNDIFPTTPVGTATYKSFFDAMLIKYYNGVGTEGLHYLYLSSSPGTKPVLSIKNFSTRIENGVQKVNYYVRDVSNQAN